DFWAGPRSLVTTEGISVDFFSSGYLDISVHRVRLPYLWIQYGIPLARWVSPFGHRRIKACCQLPDAFRRLPRPSSPLTAKASTVCACSLDHITPSRLGAIVLREQSTILLKGSLPGSRLSLYDTSDSFSNARYFPIVKEPATASTPQPINLCAPHPTRWWSQSGSNRRPPACKAGALPAELWPLGSGWWVWEDSNLRPHPYQGCALTT